MSIAPEDDSSEQPSHDDLPPPQTVQFQGPLQPHHDVVVFGRLLRPLKAYPFRRGPERMVHLVVDDRHGVDMTLEEAERFVPFIAHCIAVGMGYFGFPDDPDAYAIRRDSNPFGKVFNVVAGIDGAGQIVDIPSGHNHDDDAGGGS